MLPYKHSRFFPQYARLYNAAVSPASRLRSAGLVGNKWQLFEIGARLKLASVPFSSLLLDIGHLEKGFPECIV